MRYAAILLLVACAPCLFAVEALSLERQKPPEPGAAISIDSEQVRPLRQILDYLSTAGSVNIRAQSDALNKSTIKLDSARNVTWRAYLELICRKNGLRIDDTNVSGGVLIVFKPETVTMTFKDAELRDVIFAIATAAKINIVIDPEVVGKVTAQFHDVPWDEALDAIVKANGFVTVRENGVVSVR